MANNKISQGTIRVGAVKKGYELAFQTDEGNEIKLPFKPQNANDNGVRGTLTRSDGKPVKLVTESGKVIFDNSTVPVNNPGFLSGSNLPFTRQAPIDSFELASTLLPRTAKTAMAQLNSPDNFYLKLYKCARFDHRKKDKFYFFKTAEKGKIDFSIQADFDKIKLEAIHARHLKNIRALGFSDKAGCRVKVDANNNWRWAIGLGNASVYENGMTLHHVYGIPYIPGSGVKGMVRTWIINECFGYEKDAEARALQNGLFKAIFGHGKLGDEEGQRGSIYFFDTFPLEPPRIEPDVMNNHYQDYYEGKSPPADWLQPNPIFFLTVKGGKYRFQLGFKALDGTKGTLGDYIGFEALVSRRFNGNIQANSTLLQLTEAWLIDALREHGIGAKTAVGYGIFK